MAKCNLSHQITVSLGDLSYPIFIGSACLQDADFLHSLIPSSQVLIVTNETLAPLYLPQLKNIFSTRQSEIIILPDGELYKNQQSLNTIYEMLINKRFHRDCTLIALGGGVVGDITGFAAATYQRGVGFFQIPTTLLAQVDASIGGKTAINHACGKNMIGSFYQPNGVLIDVAILNTLPLREYKAGFAEIIKYALLSGEPFLKQLEKALKAGLPLKNQADLANMIAACCTLKAKFVQEDEKEKGHRALLNLGHTIGHALEAQTKYQRWLHGEAVAIGLYCAALLSHQLGYLQRDFVDYIEQLLIFAGLPHKIPKDISLDELGQFMLLDKKMKKNNLRFVLLKKPGLCFLNDNITQQEVTQTLLAAVEKK